MGVSPPNTRITSPEVVRSIRIAGSIYRLLDPARSNRILNTSAAGDRPLSIRTETLAAQLRANLGEVLFALAYNEFCAPTLEESVEELIKKGATHITVTTTMFTPGGSHSEVEIPEILDHLRPQHPMVELRYAWPFDLILVANTLTEQVKRFS